MLRVAACLLLCVSASYGATLTTIYRFTEKDFSSGANPDSLILGNGGVLYGTTEFGGPSANGTVFSLTPPSSPGGHWHKTMLYGFAGGPTDGQYPAGLIVDTNGVLYGVAFGGLYGNGVVFSLTPPVSPGRGWTEAILWSFGEAGDASQPTQVALNGSGLVGISSAGGAYADGTIFTLTPSSEGSWNEAVVHSFGGPDDACLPLSIASNNEGTIYVTTSYGADCKGPGTIFSWTSTGKSVIYTFKGTAQGAHSDILTVGPNGVLFGATLRGGAGGFGTFYTLTKRQSDWHLETIYSFPSTNGIPTQGSNPAAIAVSPTGTVYGVPQFGGIGAARPLRRHPGDGLILSLSPPASVGGPWQPRIEHSFDAMRDGGRPLAIVVDSANNVLYGVTYYYNRRGPGTIFAIVP